MAVKSRISVVVKDNAFSSSKSCSFLYGQEKVDRNGDKSLFIDEVVPIPENNVTFCNQTSKKSAFHNYSRNSNCIVGLVCDNDRLDYGQLFNILKQEVKSTSFYLLVVSMNETFEGKSLVLLHSTKSFKQTPFEHDICNNYNMENMPKIEVRVVCLKQSLSYFQSTWLYSMNSNQNTGNNSTKQSKQVLNGFYTNGNRDQVHTDTRDANSPLRNGCHEKRTTNSSAFKLLFLSVMWFLRMVHPRLPAIMKYFLGYLTKYLFVAKQLLYRFHQLYDVCVDRQESHKKVDDGPNSIANGNLIISLFIDIILGFLVIYFVFSKQHCLTISSWLIGQKYNVAEQLSNLLNWLMGSPAGLKLNMPLNQLLGNFYIYHVYLWTDYLYFIEIYLPTIILCCTLAGCLGVTFLLALLCDILSLLTVHIYCFYIYAVRLYGLEIHVLTYLLRLFTGKKWNVLRNRVDSVEYDVNRLFIGTLLFTILLFLFPTVFLYYIVFTSLRLLVLLVQSFLYGLVALLNSFPFFGLWLYVVNPDQLQGQVIVDTKTIPRTSEDFITIENVIQPDSCLYLSFKHKCFPCGTLFSNCASVILAAFRGIFQKGIFKKLLTGQIISKQYK